MPHIGIKRFTARNGQHHRAQGEEGNHRRIDQEVVGVQRVNRRQHMRALQDGGDAQQRQHAKPQHHNRAKGYADAPGAVFLHHEQHGQNQDGDRQHVGTQ